MNRSKNRGTAWETACVRYARDHGFPLAERRALAGSADKGDLLLCPGVIVECKDHKQYSWGDVQDWRDETNAEKANANADVAILVVKRAGKASAGDGYAITNDEYGLIWTSFATELIRLRARGWGTPLDTL